MTAPLLALNWSEKGNDGRAYKHPLNPDKKVFSVTTALKVLDKGGLAQWSADLTAAWYAANPDYTMTHSDEGAYNGGRFQWSKELARAGERGTKVHAWFEAHQRWTDYPELDEEEAQIVERLKELLASTGYTGEHVEATVWSDTHGYAGTLDSFGMLDGVPTVIDAKTSRRIHLEHVYQLSALVNADTLLVFKGTPDDEAHLAELKAKNHAQFWQEIGGWYNEIPMPQAKQAALFQVRPDDVDGSTGELVESFWKVYRISREDLDRFYPGFLAALALKRNMVETKKLFAEFESAGGTW